MQKITVYGTGCKKCQALHRSALEAAEGRDVQVEYVTDMTQIAAAGIMSTPALVVDGKVVSSGKVLSTDEVAALLA